MSKSWAGGSTSAWRRLRRSVLERDGYRCRIALSGTWTTRDGKLRRCLGTATHVHHLDGKTRGDNPARLVAACQPCNLKIGDPRKAPDPQPIPRTRW